VLSHPGILRCHYPWSLKTEGTRTSPHLTSSIPSQEQLQRRLNYMPATSLSAMAALPGRSRVIRDCLEDLASRAHDIVLERPYSVHDTATFFPISPQSRKLFWDSQVFPTSVKRTLLNIIIEAPKTLQVDLPERGSEPSPWPARQVPFLPMPLHAFATRSVAHADHSKVS